MCGNNDEINVINPSLSVIPHPPIIKSPKNAGKTPKPLIYYVQTISIKKIFFFLSLEVSSHTLTVFLLKKLWSINILKMIWRSINLKNLV
jgi:hypothetical protein